MKMNKNKLLKETSVDSTHFKQLGLSMNNLFVHKVRVRMKFKALIAR